MKNYVSTGDSVECPAAPYALASGAGCLAGTLFGVAVAAAASGAPVVLQTAGIFDLPKAASQAWTFGAKIYWDDTAKVCTTTVASNKEIGKAVVVTGAGAGETTGRIKLLSI